MFDIANYRVVSIINYVVNIADCGNLRGSVHVSRLLGEVREGLRYWSCTVHIVSCIRFTNNETINNVGVEHLEDLLRLGSWIVPIQRMDGSTR